MGRLEIAVIVDDGRVPAYALDALDALGGCEELSVFSAVGVGRPGRGRASALLGPRATARSVPVAQGRKRVVEVVEFAPVRDGAVDVLPPHVVDRLRDGGFSLALHLGRRALRAPAGLPLPVLALHIGSPTRHRDSPVALREMLRGDPVLTQGVEVLGSGHVVASAETKVHPHSYRATVAEAHRHVPLLLDRAVQQVGSGALPAGDDVAGRPADAASVVDVARLAVATARRRVRRLVYGAVVEKRWAVSTAPAPADPLTALRDGTVLPDPGTWDTLRPPRGYVFYADPFFSSDPPGILVEALRASTGRGEIVLVQDGQHRRVSPAGGHFSYPATVTLAGREHVVPETASWAGPSAYVLADGELTAPVTLDLRPDARLLDPTLVEHGGHVYLFGNLERVGNGALFLWVADSLTAPFRPHPASPVLVSPRGARMAGGLVRSGETLLRFGQDFSSGYGDGLFAFSVDRLTPTAYRERRIGEVRFPDRKGPHTLNISGDRLVFDWYRDAFAPLAGVRRVLALTGRRPDPHIGPSL
ncbi:hypothetical protein [Modestobacter sp. NPDC049651]|uniref:glucosamine inositolphosphorylceramide transferase family protein n=1 Tax=unclassified Modestobacter TaxID=2643866 RepID=UPI0033F0A418